jgi:putative transposase
MMHVHLVFVTKYRRKVFTREILDAMQIIFKNVCQNFEADLIEFDGEHDHVHLLVNYPPKVSIARLVNSLKGVSARLLRQENYPSIRKALWGQSLWSPSYFAGSCGGAPLALVKHYIQSQETPS